MEYVTYNPRLLKHVVSEGLLGNDSFVFVDVGCALGIDPIWRLFQGHLQAFAFDPQSDEIARLKQVETDPKVKYFANFVGLRASHPYFEAVRHDITNLRRYYDPFGRSSAIAAVAQKNLVEDASEEQVARTATESWATRDLGVETIGLDDFAAQENVANIDFVKTDTDGSDFQVIMSSERSMRQRDILGFLVETPYHGSFSDTANSFHNIDRFMKRQGYLLYGMSQKRYTRAALPGIFEYDLPYQTVTGQPMWGDALYLRDAAATDYAEIWGEPLSTSKILKLLCLYELFRLPDCAAELICVRQTELARITDPDVLLDLLTPPLHGQQLTYCQYIEEFNRSCTTFYPSAAATQQAAASRGDSADQPSIRDVVDPAPEQLIIDSDCVESDTAHFRVEAEELRHRTILLEEECSRARIQRDFALAELEQLRATRVWRWGKRYWQANERLRQAFKTLSRGGDRHS